MPPKAPSLAGSERRWQRRFQVFDRAAARLREPLERGVGALSDLEKEGTVQRFEFVLELAWKTLKDYLEQEGAAILPLTPRTVIKEAFAAGILADGQVWIDMLDHRNILSHTYDGEAFAQAVQAIEDRYHAAIEDLRAWFLSQGAEPWTASA